MRSGSERKHKVTDMVPMQHFRDKRLGRSPQIDVLPVGCQPAATLLVGCKNRQKGIPRRYLSAGM
jgi:hypothetical protein